MMRPPDLAPPISERALRAHLADTVEPAADDAYAERSDDDFGSVDDPCPDDFRDYYRAIELEGAL